MASVTTRIRQSVREGSPPRVGWALAIGVAVFWVFLAPGYWIFTASIAVLLAVSVLGLAVVGWVREISLAQAGLTGVALYLCGYAYRPQGGWGWPLLAAIGFAIGVTVLLSFGVALATSRLSGVYIMVLTLGLQMTIERTIFTNEKLTGGLAMLYTPRPKPFGVSLASDRVFYFVCLASLGGSLLLLSRLRASRQGRALLLVGVDRQAAAAAGVSPWRYKILAFAIAGFFGGVSGVLTGFLFGTPPSYVSFIALQSLFYLAIPVLAGVRSLVGVMVVAVAFGLAPQALEPLHISPLLLGGIAIVAGTLAGQAGISGAVRSVLKRWHGQRATAPPTEIRLDSESDPREGAPELATYATIDER